MINPTHSNRDPYNPYRQQRQSSKGLSFAELLKSSSVANSGGTQIQRSAVTMGGKEDTAEFTTTLPSWMGRTGPLVQNGVDWLAEWKNWKAPTPSYPNSVYDLSTAQYEQAIMNARDAADHIDTEGMTKTEIYNEFKTIYGNYLGKDFQDPAMLGYFGVNGNVSNGSYFAFVESLESRGVDLGDAEVEKEVKGFGGMSDDEIRVALRARYPETMTLKECILMSRELEGMGLDKSEMGGCFALDIKMILNSQLGGFHDAFNKIYGKMLDMPADYDKMMQNFKAFAANKPEDRHIYLSDSIDDAFEKILVWVGGDADAYSELYDMLKEMEQSGELRYNNAGVLWSTDFPTTDSSERKVTL